MPNDTETDKIKFENPVILEFQENLILHKIKNMLLTNMAFKVVLA